MANRRKIKKNIKQITGDLFADCVALSMCQQADQATLDQLMKEIIELHTEYVSRISHTEKKSESKFYQQLKKEFAEKVKYLSERIIKA